METSKFSSVIERYEAVQNCRGSASIFDPHGILWMQSTGAVTRPRITPSRRRRDGLIRFAADHTSQNGEDGIIARIFQLLPPVTTYGRANRRCVDIGAWDGVHLSNTHSLLFPKNADETQWRGILIEADPEKFAQLYLLHQDTENIALNVSISVDPTNSTNSLHRVLENQEILVDQHIDFLCIDIDGADYFVLHDLLLSSRFRPLVIRIEFNPTMPDDLIYIPPRSDSIRHGASLAALVELASAHDYVLVETTLYNAFFVRRREYEGFLMEIVPDTSIEALHETTMGTSMYQLYDGTLKLWGCKRMLWHRIPLDENQLQMLPMEQRVFPFAPSSSEIQEPSFDVSQVIDVSPYCQSTDCPEHEMQKCALDMYTQLQTNGFCLIRGTGIDPLLCQQVLAATNDFLQDAEETVRRSCLAADRARRGYSPMNVENFASLLGEPGPNDLVRKFRVGPLRSEWLDNASMSNSLLQENIWPPIKLWDKAPSFQATVESYYQAACAAARGVVRAICDGLLQAHPDLQDSLQPLLGGSEQSTSILTLLGYRSGTRHKGKNKGPLVAAHTDVGVVTMLVFDGGSRTCAQLQRSDGQGGWVDVELPSEVPRDPIFVLNVADCLSDLSRKQLPSTLHRVVARPESTIPRNCCALFVGLDSVTQLSIDNNEAISYEEWRKRRIAKAQQAIRRHGSKEDSNLREKAVGAYL